MVPPDADTTNLETSSSEVVNSSPLSSLTKVMLLMPHVVLFRVNIELRSVADIVTSLTGLL